MRPFSANRSVLVGLLATSLVLLAGEEGPQIDGDGVVFNVEQRRVAVLPGGFRNVFVKLGDITGGQVLVEVLDLAKGDGGIEGFRAVLPRLSMKPGDARSFRYGGTEYRLTLTHLVNKLIGTDTATLRIEQAKPTPGQAPARPGEPKGEPPAKDEKPRREGNPDREVRLPPPAESPAAA